MGAQLQPSIERVRVWICLLLLVSHVGGWWIMTFGKGGWTLSPQSSLLDIGKGVIDIMITINIVHSSPYSVHQLC